MEATKIKTHTEAGRVIARYTMFVEWKPECRRVNKATGEIKETYTYRDDDIQAYWKKKNKDFLPLDALAMYYKMIRNNVRKCVVYDNSRPKFENELYMEIDGEIIFNRIVRATLQVSPKGNGAVYYHHED